MGRAYRTLRACAAFKASQVNWWESDAAFAWWPAMDRDAAAVDPVAGGQLTQKSAGPAVPGTLWDMSNANYSSATGNKALVSCDQPFYAAIVIDKNNHAGSTNTLKVFGSNAVDSIAFGTTASTQPRFVVSVNSVANVAITQATWSPKGTALVHWVFVNPADPTNTILAGTNSTTNYSSGVLTLASGRSIGRSVTMGNSGGTTGIDFTKQGLTEFGGRAGLTFAQFQAIVAKIKAKAGI